MERSTGKEKLDSDQRVLSPGIFLNNIILGTVTNLFTVNFARATSRNAEIKYYVKIIGTSPVRVTQQLQQKR